MSLTDDRWHMNQQVNQNGDRVLPPELAKAIEEFSLARDMRLARGNEADEPKEPLFHYTSQAALQNIIRTEALWFTSIYHMDDPEELNFGFDCSRQLFQSAFDRGDQLTKWFFEELLAEDMLARVRQIFEFYSVSFGMRDDAEQWKRYAQGGTGVAFGLRPKFFHPVAVENPEPEDHVFVGQVIYGEGAPKRHLGVIDAATAVIAQQRDAGTLGNAKDAQRFYQLLSVELLVEVLWNSVTTKSDVWRHQNETRLLALNNLRTPAHKIENAGTRPRVELPQPTLKDNLSEVMIGPKSEAGLEKRVRTFLDEQGLAHVPIVKSIADLR